MSTLLHGTSSHAYGTYVTPNTRTRAPLVAPAACDQRPSPANSQQETLPPTNKYQTANSVDDADALTGAADVTREIIEERDTLGEFKAWQVSHKDFKKLQPLLSQSRLRYEYSYESKRLLVRFSTALHETVVDYLYEIILLAKIKELQKPGALDEDPWMRGGCLESKMTNSDGSKASKFIPDLSISEDSENPLLIVEVSWAQSGDDARDKVLKRMKALPSLHGAIVIDFKQSPPYRSPIRRPTLREQHIDRDQWERNLADTQWGPFQMLEHSWVGKVDCTFDIYTRSGTDAIREPQLAVIPTLGNTEAFDRSLSKVWQSIVKAKMPAVEAEVLTVNWEAFRKRVKRALLTTGYNRFSDWRGKLKRSREDDDDDGDEPQSSSRAKRTKIEP